MNQKKRALSQVKVHWYIGQVFWPVVNLTRIYEPRCSHLGPDEIILLIPCQMPRFIIALHSPLTPFGLIRGRDWCKYLGWNVERGTWCDRSFSLGDKMMELRGSANDSLDWERRNRSESHLNRRQCKCVSAEKRAIDTKASKSEAAALKRPMACGSAPNQHSAIKLSLIWFDFNRISSPSLFEIPSSPL